MKAERLSQAEFAKRVAERQRITGQGRGKEEGAEEARAKAEMREEARLQVLQEKAKAPAGVTAGRRHKASESEIEVKEREILRQRSLDEVQRQRRIEAGGGPNQGPGTYARIAKERGIDVYPAPTPRGESYDAERGRQTSETEAERQLRLKQEFEQRTGRALELTPGQKEALHKRRVESLSPEDRQTYESLKSSPASAESFLDVREKQAARRTIVFGTPSGPTGQTTIGPDGSAVSILGSTIVGGPSEQPSTLKVKRGALTADQLRQVKELEAQDPDWKYSGELTPNPDGSYTFYGESITESKRYREELVAVNKANAAIAKQNALSEKDAAAFNRSEEARLAREEKKIFTDAKELGYDIKKTEVKRDDGTVEYQYEYVPIKGKKQYALVDVDPTNPHKGKKKVPVEYLGRGEAVAQFQKEYAVRDTSALGQFGEFGTGIKAQGESYAEVVGYKPSDASALNTVMGINPYQGKYQKKEGETDAQFRKRVVELEAKERRAAEGRKTETYVDERGRTKIRGVEAGKPTEAEYGSVEYQKQKVFESIAKNPARFTGELFTEGVAFAAGGEVVSAGAKGVAKVVKVIKSVAKGGKAAGEVGAPAARTTTGRSFGNIDEMVGGRFESGGRLKTEVVRAKPEKIAKVAKSTDNRGRFTRENIERGFKLDTAEPSMKPSPQKVAKEIKPDLDESQRIEQAVMPRPDVEVRPTLESDTVLTFPKDTDFYGGAGAGIGGGGRPSRPGDTGKGGRPEQPKEEGREIKTDEGQLLILKEPEIKPKAARRKTAKEKQIEEQLQKQTEEFGAAPSKTLKDIYTEIPEDASLKLKQKKTEELIQRKQPEIDQAVRDSEDVKGEIKNLDDEMKQLEAEEEALKQQELLGDATQEQAHEINQRLGDISNRKNEIIWAKDRKLDDLQRIQERKAQMEKDVEAIRERRKIKKAEYLGAKQRVMERKIEREGKAVVQETPIYRPENKGVSLGSLGFGGETGFERMQLLRKQKLRTTPQEEERLPQHITFIRQEREIISVPKQRGMVRQDLLTVPKQGAKTDEMFITTPKQDLLIDTLTIPKEERITTAKTGLLTEGLRTPKPPGEKPARPPTTAPPLMFPLGGGGSITGKEPKELGGVGIKDYSVENILFQSFSLTEKGGFKYTGEELRGKDKELKEQIGFGSVESVLFGGKPKKGKKGKGKGMFEGLF